MMLHSRTAAQPHSRSALREIPRWWRRPPVGRRRHNLLPALLSIAVAGVSGGFVEGAFAQSAPNVGTNCTVPNPGNDAERAAVIDALDKPPLTAAMVNNDLQLKEFILHYRNKVQELEGNGKMNDYLQSACILRDDLYNSDSTYMVTLNLDGRVLAHGRSMLLSERQLKLEVYAAILKALLDISDEEAKDLARRLRSGDGAAVKEVRGKGERDSSFSVGGEGGHVATYYSRPGGLLLYILLAGFELDERHLVPLSEEGLETYDDLLTTTARDVKDKDSLKAFVDGVADTLDDFISGPAISTVRLILRRSPVWQYNSVYSYLYNEFTDEIYFHGGNPDEFEFRKPGIATDPRSGKLVWTLVKEAADKNNGDGDFFEYYFDNPNDDSDEPVLKVGFARKVVVTVTGGRQLTFIVGSGFYPSEVAAAEQPKQASLKGWNVRFGRTVAQQVVDTLQNRFVASPQAGLDLTVAGERLNGTTPLEDNHELFSKLLGFETVTPYQLAQGSSFSFSASDSGAPVQLSFWGTGALSSFSGSEDKLSLEGDVTTAMVGADWSGARWHAGAALTRSWGSGSYDGTQDNDGDLTATLTGVFPYGRYALTPRLGMWATAGYGRGELSFKPDGDAEYKPGTTLTMAAAGIDGVLLDGGNDGISLSTTADALTLKTTSEEVDGLASSEGDVSRFRLGLEARRPFPLANGASLLPSLELGLRQDSGDAETGFGVDLGAGLAWAAPELGISAELSGRTLLTHADDDFQDKGLALSFSWDPIASNVGPYLSMRHAVGSTASGGMDSLLNPVALQLPADAPSASSQRFETQLAYGMAIFDERLVLSPSVDLALSPDSRRYGLLWALQPHSQQGQADPWHLSLGVHRQEWSSQSSPVDHSLRLGFSLAL